MLMRVGDPAEQQEVAHLLGDLDRDIDLRLAGRRAEVRGRDEVGRAEQGRVRGRLGLEHVERGAADLAAVERRPSAPPRRSARRARN